MASVLASHWVRLHARPAFCSSLVVSTLAGTLMLTSGCPATPVAESNQFTSAVETTIANAQKKKLWTLADEREFTKNMDFMSLERRFEFAQKIAALINSKEMAVEPRPSKTPSPPICRCVPGSCDPTTPTPAPPKPAAGAAPTDTKPASKTP